MADPERQFKSTAPRKMYRFYVDWSKPRYWLRRNHLLQFGFYRGSAGVWQVTLGPFRLMRIRKYASARDFMNEAHEEMRAGKYMNEWFGDPDFAIRDALEMQRECNRRESMAMETIPPPPTCDFCGYLLKPSDTYCCPSCGWKVAKA